MKIKYLPVALLAATTLILSSCGAESNTDSLDDWMESMDNLEAEYEDIADEYSDDETESYESESDVTTDEPVVNDDVDVSSDDDTAEWDGILDDYDSWADDYISLVKKQKNDPTDMSVITDMASMASKQASWGTKMSDAADNLSADQASRLSKIQMRIAQAAM
ncbi:MAG: hypothetical protein ACI9J3_003805 [Parvicellaceae bacterium]|jgi:hypothetical protein